MAVETVFGITQAGRPCRICLRMGGYCHHHVSQQPPGGYCSPATPHQRHQPVDDRHASNQRVFGYTQRGFPCKICLKRGDYCHLHESQRDGSGQRPSPEINIDEIHYGITLKGKNCKICIRKGGFCRMHEGQRPQQRESPPPPRGESYPASSPQQETRRISPLSSSPQQGTRRSSPQQHETRRVSSDNARSPRSSRPGRIHNVERQRLIYGNDLEGREQNVERVIETTQTRTSSRHRRRSEGRHVTSSNSNSATGDTTRSSSLPRRTIRIRSTQEHTRSSSATYRSSPERQSSRRNGGHHPATMMATPTTALNMSNEEMDEQFYRLLGLFSEYMRSVQQDEDERHRRRRGSFDRSVSAGRRRGGENNGFPDASGGGVDEMQQQNRISVDSLREFVNESMAAAGRRPSPQRRRSPSGGFPSAAQAAARTTPTTPRQRPEPSSVPVAVASGAVSANSSVDIVASSPPEEGSSSSRSVLECTICLEDLQNGGHLQFLPCGHGFHSDCLQQWRSYSHYCPLCRDSTANIF